MSEQVEMEGRREESRRQKSTGVGTSRGKDEVDGKGRESKESKVSKHPRRAKGNRRENFWRLCQQIRGLSQSIKLENNYHADST